MLGGGGVKVDIVGVGIVGVGVIGVDVNVLGDE